jgi:hypothetical protein
VQLGTSPLKKAQGKSLRFLIPMPLPESIPKPLMLNYGDEDTERKSMPSETELERLFKFNAEDLAANRSGALSQQQKERLAKSFKMRRIGGTLFGLVFTGIGIWLLVSERETILGGIFLFLGLAIAYGFWQVGSVKVDDLQVEQVSGWVDKKFEQRQETSEEETVTETDYYLIIGEKRFKVASAQYNAFKVGDLYRFYYFERQSKLVTEAPQILAAEISAEETKKHELT